MCDIMDSQDRRRPSLLSAVSQNMTRLYEPCHDEPNLRHFQIHRPPAATLLQINFTPLCAGSFYFIRIGCVSLKKIYLLKSASLVLSGSFGNSAKKTYFSFSSLLSLKGKWGGRMRGKGKRISEKKIS